MIRTLTIVMAFFVVFQSNSMACSAMGTNKHVGLVIAVNATEGTFTLMDAQLKKPLIFTASSEVLHLAKNTNGRVIIVFKQENNQLVATALET